MKFKVGDRVIGYKYTGVNVGIIEEISDSNCFILLRYDNGYSEWFHEKQCRRLVKKKDKIQRNVIVEAMDYHVKLTMHMNDLKERINYLTKHIRDEIMIADEDFFLIKERLEKLENILPDVTLRLEKQIRDLQLDTAILKNNFARK